MSKNKTKALLWCLASAALPLVYLVAYHCWFASWGGSPFVYGIVLGLSCGILVVLFMAQAVVLFNDDITGNR